jgi:hypothetical protein
MPHGCQYLLPHGLLDSLNQGPACSVGVCECGDADRRGQPPTNEQYLAGTNQLRDLYTRSSEPCPSSYNKIDAYGPLGNVRTTASTDAYGRLHSCKVGIQSGYSCNQASIHPLLNWNPTSSIDLSSQQNDRPIQARS